MNKIIQYYRDYGYPSYKVLFSVMKTQGEKVTLQQVKEAIESQLVSQMHKKQKTKIGGHMLAFFENEKWLMDLLDMQNFKYSNRGNRYILIVCDVFSRKGYAIPLKNKNADTVLNAFKEIVNNNGHPAKLISDNGSEFLNHQMKTYLDSKHIFHETNEVGYHKALGVIDAFSRTIKNKIYKSFTDNNNTGWVNELPRLVKGYNNSPHQALLGLTPNDVKNHSEVIEKLNTLKNLRTRAQTTKFKVGQIVRKKLARGNFTKGYKRSWSTHTYTIKSIQGVNATLDNDDVVKLNDLQIIPYEPESKEPYKDVVQEVEKERQIDRRVAKEGIERNEVALRRSARERKPNRLLTDKGERIIW